MTVLSPEGVISSVDSRTREGGAFMKKLLIPLAVLVLLALATPAFAEWELGMSWTPVSQTVYGNQTELDSIVGYHVAYSWSILYLSWDAFALPNFMVENWTGYWDGASQRYVSGYYAPGFLNLFDVGIKLNLKPLVAFAEVGTNCLYVYQEGMLPGGFGANLRVGAGVKFGWIGVSLTGTSVFASWQDLTATLDALGDKESRAWAWNNIVESLVPSLQVTFYLK
jgi:hypothetical protein